VIGTRRLADRVGPDAARGLLQTSRSFSTGEAMSMGFLHRVARHEDWDQIVRQAGDEASVLEGGISRTLFDLTRVDSRDADLAALVRSAAAPGIKARIGDYRTAAQTKKVARA